MGVRRTLYGVHSTPNKLYLSETVRHTVYVGNCTLIIVALGMSIQSQMSMETLIGRECVMCSRIRTETVIRCK